MRKTIGATNPPTPSPARSAATSRRRCRTTSSTAPTRRSPRRARSRSGSPPMSSPEPGLRRAQRRAAVDANERGVHRRARRRTGATRRSPGASSGSPSRSVGCSATSPASTSSSSAAAPRTSRAWLARRGARPVGVDPTPAQLATARRMQARDRDRVPARRGAGRVRCRCPDASFDLALSEYGASLWADPDALDPGGGAAAASRRPARLPHELGARRTSARPTRASSASSSQRPQFGMHRIEWPGRGGHRVPPRRTATGSGCCASTASSVEALHELQAPADARRRTGYYDYVTAEWARRWPAEEIWVARKRCE